MLLYNIDLEVPPWQDFHAYWNTLIAADSSCLQSVMLPLQLSVSSFQYCSFVSTCTYCEQTILIIHSAGCCRAPLSDSCPLSSATLGLYILFHLLHLLYIQFIFPVNNTEDIDNKLFVCVCFVFSISRLELSLLLEVECIWGLPPVLFRLHRAVCCGHPAAAGLHRVCGDAGLTGSDVWGHARRPTAAAKFPEPLHQRNEVCLVVLLKQNQYKAQRSVGHTGTQRHEVICSKCSLASYGKDHKLEETNNESVIE